MSYIFPDKFIERYKQIIPDLDNFLQILQTPLRQSFRINTIKAIKQEVLSKLADIKLEPIPWCDIAFRIIDPINIGERIEHQIGLIYSQEAVSMIPALVLDPKPNDKILDICAAPGSKTTQIAQMMNNTGCIVANDISKKRINALISNIERLGILNTVITMQVGQKLGYYAPEYFDKVLLDAPCSLEGTIRNTPEVLLNWKVTTIRRLAKLQKGLINSAYKCLKPDGVLVYSTCTFAPEENEGVIDYLLKKNPDVSIEPITLNSLKTRPAVLDWGDTHFNDKIKNAIRIYPQDNDTEGFFVAKIHKPQMGTDKNTRLAQIKNLCKSVAKNSLLDELKTQYHLPDKIFKNYQFEERGNKIFIMTKEVKEFDKIRPVRKGLLFAERKGNKIIIFDSAKQTIIRT